MNTSTRTLKMNRAKVRKMRSEDGEASRTESARARSRARKQQRALKNQYR